MIATLEFSFREAVCACIKAGFLPWNAMQAVDRHGLVGGIARTVRVGAKESGFDAIADLGLVEFTLESLVTRFADQFNVDTQNAAGERLRRRAKSTAARLSSHRHRNSPRARGRCA